MGVLIQVLAALPLALLLGSWTLCALAARSSNVELNPSAAPTAAAQLARRKSTFDYTRLSLTNSTDNIITDAQPKGNEIKFRNLLLFFLSLIPTIHVLISLVLVLESHSKHHPPSQSIYGLLVTLAGWIVVLVTLLGVITRHVRYMNAIQPLQWFYSATFGVLLYEYWNRLDLILEDFGHYSTDMRTFFGVSATVVALFVLALTMPVELDLDFVHQYGYGYSSVSCGPYLSFVDCFGFRSTVVMQVEALVGTALLREHRLRMLPKRIFIGGGGGCFPSFF